MEEKTTMVNWTPERARAQLRVEVQELVDRFDDESPLDTTDIIRTIRATEFRGSKRMPK